ncbi:hypothetical protein JHK82_018865 [Glycine max]|uniref:Uncharacterized protein n=1 Tax=Glycine max TaxID=3847 RepID=A0A0R0J520_SOYBN|nr:hypothetical protein JHK85_019308 [Glycine max]KAG5143170.1 hypothetical protein JHK82_018865 [Glycine max]
MIGRICRKSPPKTITLPPKILLSFELFPLWILQVESSKTGTGILNFECAVLPPGNNREVMLLEATIITILLSALSELASVFQMYVFPVPPYP